MGQPVQDGNSKDFVVKMEAPKEQMSAYQDNAGKTATRPVGVQEPRTAVTPAPASTQTNPAPSK